MKQILLAALLCALLLGCGPAVPAKETSTRLTPTKETENDNLRCYPLSAADCRFLTLGEDLLVLRPGENGAELLRCAGKGLTITARAEVPEGSELVSDGKSICCYDPQAQQVLRFSPELTLLQTVSLPQCSAPPVLWGDRLYYTTDQALMELDTGTLIHRTLRLQSGLCLTAVLEDGALAVCSGEWESLYIRTSDGTVQQRSDRITGAAVLGSRVHLCVKCGFLDCLYLGQSMLPLSPEWSFLTFLPQKNAVLVVQEGISLGIYDLSTGNRLAERALGTLKAPDAAWATEDGRIFFTAGGALYQWEPVWDVQRDSRVKISALYTQEKPNEKGLEQCRQRGAYLENQYGLQVLLHTDAVQIAPRGVELEPEHITSILLDTLAGVEKALGRFPTQMMKAAFSGGGRVYLCPVRSIRADGQQKRSMQFWSGRDCYLFITPSADIQWGVIQAISPLLDRQILMKSDAYDAWDSLNPPGFVYGQNTWNATAFASPACLESPAADRAGLLYAAVSSGNRELFLSAQLQNKLRALCTGIRQAFPLGIDAKRPWEQYLWEK